MYPKVVYKGVAGHVFDVDGNEYVDLISGLGSISVGYNNEEVNAAVINQLNNGVSFSLPTMLEYHVAKRLTELFPHTEMWKYGKNGVDATLMAIRCARAYTGRNKILVHGYHGCSDHFESLGTRQAGMVDMSAVTEVYSKPPTINNREYAAVIIESYVFDSIDWSALQIWCKATGTLLIVDEIVSGGRFPGFSAYAYLGLVPDLVCVGKGLANGFPMSAVGGRKEIMQTFDRDDFFASTTFGGETISLAACLKTLDILQKNLDSTISKGQLVKDMFNMCFAQLGIGKCKGYPTRLTFDFEDKCDKAIFMQEMCKRGVLIGYSNMVMVEHTASDLETIITAFKDIVANWNSFKLEGDMPVEALRLRNR